MGWMGKGWGDQAGGLGSCEFGAIENRPVAGCEEFSYNCEGLGPGWRGGGATAPSM